MEQKHAYTRPLFATDNNDEDDDDNNNSLAVTYSLMFLKL